MALLTPPFALGAAGQALSGRLLRLSLGATFRPAATGVQVVSGVLAGPPNTQGELTLAGGVLTAQPFRAVIQSALDATAGSYEVINDAAYTFPALTAQHASQYRRSLVVVRVDDSQVSGVASTATTDRAVLEVLDGALAASAGATVLPTPAGSWLALGELLIPPVGQTITVTPYNPRTTTRGGILPVLADGSAITGHDGVAPGFDGQVRWHPTYGLQGGRAGVWGDAILPQSVAYPGIGGQIAVAGYAAPRVTLAAGRVTGAGLLQDSSARAAGATIGTLPVGYRPLNATHPLTVGGTNATGVTGLYRLDVATTGVVTTVPAVPANTYYFLDNGFSFPINN